jgi:hypothetical protein
MIIKSLIRGTVVGLILSLFLFLFIPSCQTMGKETDKRLKPYIETFVILCSKYKKNCSDWRSYKYIIMPIPKTLNDIINPQKDSKTIGRCNRINKTIIIDETYFNNSPTSHIESTVIHEMGHCVLKKSHDETNYPTIMNAYAMSDWFYVRYYQSLMNQFFECKVNCPDVDFNINKYYKE